MTHESLKTIQSPSKKTKTIPQKNWIREQS